MTQKRGQAGTSSRAKEKDATKAPKKHSEAYTKATVVLFDRQVVYLDALNAKVREATGKGLKRAEVIRALVDALKASNIRPEEMESEEALRKLVTKRLRGKF